jgi:hypothetical protein
VIFADSITRGTAGAAPRRFRESRPYTSVAIRTGRCRGTTSLLSRTTDDRATSGVRSSRRTGTPFVVVHENFRGPTSGSARTVGACDVCGDTLRTIATTPQSIGIGGVEDIVVDQFLGDDPDVAGTGRRSRQAGAGRVRRRRRAVPADQRSARVLATVSAVYGDDPGTGQRTRHTPAGRSARRFAAGRSTSTCLSSCGRGRRWSPATDARSGGRPEHAAGNSVLGRVRFYVRFQMSDLNNPDVVVWLWGGHAPLDEEDSRRWPSTATSSIRSDPLWQQLRATSGNDAVAARIALIESQRRQSDR